MMERDVPEVMGNLEEVEKSRDKMFVHRGVAELECGEF